MSASGAVAFGIPALHDFDGKFIHEPYTMLVPYSNLLVLYAMMCAGAAVWRMQSDRALADRIAVAAIDNFF